MSAGSRMERRRMSFCFRPCRVDGHPTASDARNWCPNNQPRRPSATDAITVGLDIAKSVFHVHPVDGSGKVLHSRKLRRSQVEPFFAKLPRGAEGSSLRHGTSLGAHLGRAGARGAADSSGVCEAVPPPQQE
jgi:hypothetical protein